MCGVCICDEPQLRLKMAVNRSAFWDLHIFLLNVFIPIGECFLCINTFSVEPLLAAVLPTMNQLQFSDHNAFIKGIGRSNHDVHPFLNGEKPEVTDTIQERAVLRFAFAF